MSKYADFLVEIQTEELPPKTLRRLEISFLNEVKENLNKAALNFKEIFSFATPRRLALLVTALSGKQADTVVERKGPALENAYDEKGHPTPACVGFARSCGVTPNNLITIKGQGSATWVGFKQKVLGKSTQELLPDIIQQALSRLPIAKRMRWGANTTEFVRPVHSVIMLYGSKVIPADILGCKAGRKTRGHRFLTKGLLDIKTPSDYISTLENKGYVIPDFNRRKAFIGQEAESLTQKMAAKNVNVLISEDLLDEVTGLVEWPMGVWGNFDKEFLKVPQEVLISAMQDHQRYFAITDQRGKLLPHFITISNIPSKDMNRVVEGNERVLRARLQDAAFFFETDKKQTLEKRLPLLKDIIFQAKLGTLFDKSERLKNLSGFIAHKLNQPVALAERAGLLSKTDLTTQLVGEFPELQGIAGFYYAKESKEDEIVAKALNEQYLPRFSGSKLPTTPVGCVLALADRLDTLVGIFGIGQIPTGDKDPYGLRRAALGILRILIEKKLTLDLRDLLAASLSQYQIPLENSNLLPEVTHFILDRLKPWYLEQGITPDVFAAVAALNSTVPFEIHCRIQAVQQFKKMTEAESLSIANKRVSNILSQYNKQITLQDINEQLFEHDAERVLAKKLKEHQSKKHASVDYSELLSELAGLRKPVDDFFDHVMVMTEDKDKRENRLLMLKKLRELFLQVADIALLQ